MKKIFIKNFANNANKWIYNGYTLAWKKAGFEVERYEKIKDINPTDSYVMAVDWDITSEGDIDILAKSNKTFLFVQPTKYELPWSAHPNFMCFLPTNFIEKINSVDNIHKWTFVDFDHCDYYYVWNNLHKYPLAFDHISYNKFEKNNNHKFDICYVGGRAHNGFDEKYKIMIKTFSAFKDSGLKCGFFVEKNLTHEQEKSIIFNSKLCLNIHDAYQIKTSIDTNERTFKTLGINGGLVCSSNGQLNRLFPNIKTAETPEDIVKIAKQLCSLSKNTLEDMKQENRKNILQNHTYSSRVEAMIGSI